MSRIILGAGAVAALALIAETASAQVLMGTAPYSPGPHSTFSAQAHISEKLNSNGGASSGLAALNQYVTSSTTVGNINNVTVGDNANAMVDASQTTSGNQGSTAETSLKSTTNNTTNNNSNNTPGH